MIWDQGTWIPEGDPDEQYRRGKLVFQLQGKKLRGEWTLVRMSGRGGEEEKNWLLVKRNDAHAKAKSEFDPLKEMPDSVNTGRSMKQITDQADAVWSDGENRKNVAKASESNGGASSLPQTMQEVSDLAGASQADQPQTVKPQLPTLVQEPPVSEGWLHELKMDGYRIMIVLRDGKATLLTRRGNDWTERFSAIAKEAEQLPILNAVIDGEVVSLRPDGTTDFQALQNAMRNERSDKLLYYAFDIPWCAGYDLKRVPLLKRKALLRSCLESATGLARIRFTDHIDSRGQAVFQHACEHSLEGIVSKRVDSGYQQGRTRSWVKVKCLKRQEFVIGGYSAPSGSRKHFGSLLLGYYNDQRRLVYCGRVGTGFTTDSLQEVAEQLQRRETGRCPFDEPPERAESRGVTWVAPELVAEVGFTQWTDDGRLRHPTFQGLREDKQPYQVTREEPTTAPSTTKAPAMDGDGGRTHSQRDTFCGVRLSNPDRVLYPEQGCTKRDLASYYAKAADAILPHLTERPLTLVRCPRGRSKECFYQKHFTESFADPDETVSRGHVVDAPTGWARMRVRRNIFHSQRLWKKNSRKRWLFG